MVRRLLLSGVAIAILGANLAWAGEVLGEWSRVDGKARVRFARCGDAICGAISWLENPGNSKATIGQRVFSGMKPSGDNVWTGAGFSPEEGMEFAGTMTLAGNHLSTSGCALGGLICRTVEWSRAR